MPNVLDDLARKFDANAWADAFVGSLKARPEIATDLDLMQVWFRRALMCGFDEGRRMRDAAESTRKHERPVSRTVLPFTQKARVLRIMRATGPIGITAAELAPRLTAATQREVSKNQTATRLLELREAGFVTGRVESGEQVYRSTGLHSKGQVWVLTNEGLDEARRLAEATKIQQAKKMKRV